MASKLGIATRLWLLVALLLSALAVTGGYGAYALHGAQERNAQNLASMRSLLEERRDAAPGDDAWGARVRREETRLATADAATLREAVTVQGGVFVFTLVLSVLLAAWLVASVRRPLREVIVAAMRVAEGDLSSDVRVYGRDEAARLMQATSAMTQQLRGLVQEVAQRARIVADSSAQVAQGHLDLSQRTEEQATTLEETASQMEELTTTVAQSADHARQASKYAGEASVLATRGGEVVAEVVNTMGRISESSGRIAEITSLIDGIAFQTNILALNAAVEAARAGEQGRGFAVVAGEVRTLAQRSANAAREIRTLIADSVQQVDDGAHLVTAAGRTMEEIVAAVRQVSTLMAEVAAASGEQSAGIEQVNTAVTQMDHVVQQNAALVEEAAAAMDSMREQARALLQSVQRFRLGAQQEHAAQSASASPWRQVRAVQLPGSAA
jgi:methyl-accepting chemotaxis protein